MESEGTGRDACRQCGDKAVHDGGGTHDPHDLTVNNVPLCIVENNGRIRPSRRVARIVANGLERHRAEGPRFGCKGVDPRISTPSRVTTAEL